MFNARNRSTLLICFAVAAALLLPSAAQAQVDFGLRGGYYTDIEEVFLGGEVLTRIDGSQWFFNPNVEWVFLENGDLITVNADFHYDFPTTGQISVWLGGGPALILREREFGDDETDGGLNLLAGVGFDPQGAVRPYIQGKVIVSDETEAVIAFGLRFF